MGKKCDGKAPSVRARDENKLPGRGVFDNCPSGMGVYILAGLVLAIAFFVFKDFLLFKNVYLFKDIGSDSVNSTYPRLVHLSHYVRNSGLPGWSFSQGMGQNMFPFLVADNFLGLLLLLPPGAVAYGIVYVEVLKALLAGIFFYLYLRTLSLSLFASVIGGVLYAFSGYIVLGGCWSIFSSEALFAALLLYAFEKFLKENVWFLLPIPVALLGMHQPFYWFLYTIFIFVYATARFLQEGVQRPGELPAFCLKLICLGLLGAAISAVFSFSNILQMLQSPRGGEASLFHALFSQPVFRAASSLERGTAILRFFSNDMLGVGSKFRGYHNYLEAPIFYCGLASLLLAPQIFYFSDKRRKAISAFLLLLCALPIIFPFFRWAFWCFAGDYYRTFSLVVVLFLLWFSLQSLSFIDKTGRLSPLLLAGTLATLLMALFFPFIDGENCPVDWRLRNIVAIFLAGYAALICLMGRRELKFCAQTLFLAAVCAELGYFSFITVNRRPVISARELGDKTGYNDYSVDAVTWLKSTDPTFFRVAKTYFSGPAIDPSLNDAQIQGYNGTASYSPFNQLYYVRFLGELGLRNAADNLQTHWIGGLEHPFRPLLLTFASVKYALTREPGEVLGAGYKLRNRFGDVSVLENMFFLPLGFTYDKYIAYEDFKALPAASKEQILLRAFVAGSDDIKDLAGLEVFDPAASAEALTPRTYGEYVTGLKEETLCLTERGQNRLAGTIVLKKKKFVFFSIPYDKGWKTKVDRMPADLKLVNIGFMGLPLEKGRHSVELHFTPPLLHAGALVSAMGLLLYCLLVGWSLKRAALRGLSG